MSEERIPQSADKYILRFPEGMREALKHSASVNGRSLNAELVHRLQASIDGNDGLHLPEGMLKRLQAAAKKTGRSVDGELLDRMITSLADLPPAEVRLREVLEEERKENARLRMENDELLHKAWKRQTMLYVLLDTNGYPISWAEIHEHLRGIKQAGGFNPDQMHTNIITPDMESSSRRASEAATLAKLWRAGGRPIMSESPAIADDSADSKSRKVIRRTRKPDQSSAEAEADGLVRKRLVVGELDATDNKVIIRQTLEKPKPALSKGPVRSPNVRKPKT